MKPCLDLIDFSIHWNAKSEVRPTILGFVVKNKPVNSILRQHQKVQMRNDGIDPVKVSDQIYYLEKGVYKLMDMAAYQKITSVGARL